MSKGVQCVHNAILFLPGHAVVHGDGQDFIRVLLCDGEAPGSISEILIGLGEMRRDRVVNDGADLLLIQEGDQGIPVLASNDILVPDAVGVLTLPRQDQLFILNMGAVIVRQLAALIA